MNKIMAILACLMISLSMSAQTLKLYKDGQLVMELTHEQVDSVEFVAPPAPVLVSGITLSATSLKLEVGVEQLIVATVLPEDATNKAVTWSSSNDAVATVQPTGVVTAVGEGVAVITCMAADASGVSTACEVTVVAPAPVPESVDLGLPSGTQWATYNIGASKPEEYGDYFAWAETEPKEEYLYTNHKYSKLDESDGRWYWTKYCSRNGYQGFTDDKTRLDHEDDAAIANWGTEWRMPTADQMRELIDDNYTTIVETMQNGVNGLLITSKANGNSIFLPKAGFYHQLNRRWTSIGEGCWYQTVDSYKGENPWCLEAYYSYGDFYLRCNMQNRNRYDGMSVRPVRVLTR